MSKQIKTICNGIEDNLIGLKINQNELKRHKTKSKQTKAEQYTLKRAYELRFKRKLPGDTKKEGGF